jgi:hypothetical protein
MSRATLFVLTFTLATGLAMVSYHLLEHPIRTSRWLNRYRVPVVAIGLTASVVGGLVLAPAILETDGVVSARATAGERRRSSTSSRPRPGADTRLLREARAGLHGGFGRPGCVCCSSATATLACGYPRSAPSPRTSRGRSRWRCPARARGSGAFVTARRAREVRADCRRHQEDWYTRVVPPAEARHRDPRASGLRRAQLPAADGASRRLGRQRRRPPFRAADSRTHPLVDPRARSNGPKIVIIEPLVRAPVFFDPLDCLSSGKPLGTAVPMWSRAPVRAIRSGCTDRSTTTAHLVDGLRPARMSAAARLRSRPSRHDREAGRHPSDGGVRQISRSGDRRRPAPGPESSRRRR